MSRRGTQNQAQKRQRSNEDFLATHIANMNNIIDAIREEKDIWKRQDLDRLRSFVCEVVAKPTEFPLQVDLEKRGNNLELTKGFATALYEKKLESSANNPVVQVYAVTSRKVEVSGIANHGKHYTLRYTVEAIDGDHKVVVLVMNSCLNSIMGTLEIGHIIQLTDFVPIYRSVDDGNQHNCRILANSYDILALTNVPEEFYKPDVAPSEATVSVEKNPSVEDVSKCNGYFCSINGVTFLKCISELKDPKSIELGTIARDNPFVDIEVEKMKNSEKRFILYYWYATNIYKVSGKSNRLELPDCLTTAIRNLYPEEDGVYNGYELSNIHDQL